MVKDVIGREWWFGTVQVDYNLPERFDLNYKGATANSQARDDSLRSVRFMERFCGVLIDILLTLPHLADANTVPSHHHQGRAHAVCRSCGWARGAKVFGLRLTTHPTTS